MKNMTSRYKNLKAEHSVTQIKKSLDCVMYGNIKEKNNDKFVKKVQNWVILLCRC